MKLKIMVSEFTRNAEQMLERHDQQPHIPVLCFPIHMTTLKKKGKV